MEIQNCLKVIMFILQEEFKMSKRQKKKALVVKEGPEVEVVTKTEYIYEDTQCVSGVEPEYKWGVLGTHVNPSLYYVSILLLDAYAL